MLFEGGLSLVKVYIVNSTATTGNSLRSSKINQLKEGETGANINPTISTITSNENGLNTPTKERFSEWTKDRPKYKSPTGTSHSTQRRRQLKSKGMGKGLPC